MTACINFTLIVAYFNQPEEENIYFYSHLTYSYDNTPRTPGVFGANFPDVNFIKMNYPLPEFMTCTDKASAGFKLPNKQGSYYMVASDRDNQETANK